MTAKEFDARIMEDPEGWVGLETNSRELEQLTNDPTDPICVGQRYSM